MMSTSRYGMTYGYKYVKGTVKFFVDCLKAIMAWLLNWSVFLNSFALEFLTVLSRMRRSVNVHPSLTPEHARPL